MWFWLALGFPARGIYSKVSGRMRADRGGDPSDGLVRELKGKIEQDAAFSLRLRGSWAKAGALRKMESLIFPELGTTASNKGKMPTKPSVVL